MKPTLIEGEHRKLAEKIARTLFTSVSSRGKRKAKRLVLEMSDENYSGTGWCKQSVVDEIMRVLNGKP